MYPCLDVQTELETILIGRFFCFLSFVGFHLSKMDIHVLFLDV